MSDELKKDIIPSEEPRQAEQEIVEEDKTPVEEETKTEETPKQEEVVTDEENKEDEPTEVLPEGESDDDKVSGKTEDSKPAEEVADASDAVEEVPETVKEEVDIDAIRAELEELKAEKEERADVENLNKENARVAREYDELCGQISGRLEAKLKELGIPLDKSITDLETEDKAKAEIARKLIGDANELIEKAKVAATDFLNKKAQDVIFKKADRLLRKYDVTEEEADVVANTFLDIITQSGVRDLEDDLRAKVELAVAKAKMVCQHVSKTAELVKEKADEVTEKIEKVEEIITPPKTEEPEKAPEPEKEKIKEVKAEEQEPPKPTLDTAEFEEGAVSKPQPTASITVDNVLDKMAALPYKEQTQFYKENMVLIEEALRRGVK